MSQNPNLPGLAAVLKAHLVSQFRRCWDKKWRPHDLQSSLLKPLLSSVLVLPPHYYTSARGTRGQALKLHSEPDPTWRSEREATSAAAVCSYCERTFNGLSKKRDLKRHIDCVHLKLKTFNCDHCKYSSSQKSNVKGHMVRMHGAVVTTRNYSSQPNQYTLKRQREQGHELGWANQRPVF